MMFGERCTKRRSKRRFGAEPRIIYTVSIYYEVRGIRSISPVTKWNSSTAMDLQLHCSGGERGYDFISPILCMNKEYNHCHQKVHMKQKCEDCERLGILKINGWIAPEKILANVRTEICEVELSGFEPIDGLHFVHFLDEFEAFTEKNEKTDPFFVAVNNPTVIRMAGRNMGRINGIEITYTRK